MRLLISAFPQFSNGAMSVAFLVATPIAIGAITTPLNAYAVPVSRMLLGLYKGRAERAA